MSKKDNINIEELDEDTSKDINDIEKNGSVDKKIKDTESNLVDDLKSDKDDEVASNSLNTESEEDKTKFDEESKKDEKTLVEDDELEEDLDSEDEDFDLDFDDEDFDLDFDDEFDEIDYIVDQLLSLKEDKKKMDKYIKERDSRLPMIAMRGITVLPYTLQSFDIGRPASVKSFEKAMESNEKILLVTQRDIRTEYPQINDLYEYGTVCEVKQVINTSGNSIRVLVEGIYKAHLDKIEFTEDGAMMADLTPCRIADNAVDETEALVVETMDRRVKRLFDEYLSTIGGIPTDATIELSEVNEYYERMMVIAANLFLKQEEKQEILDVTQICNLMALMEDILAREIEVVKIDKQISSAVKKQMNKIQKDYYLREQMKAIQKELGDMSEDGESTEFMEQLEKLNVPAKTKEKIKKEIERFERTPMGSPDYNVSRNYLETIFSLPWNKESRNRFDIKKSEKILNEDHYGLDDVKERILEYLAVKKVSKALNAPVICLAGPPGVGKTSIAKSVARSLGRQFVRISLGGVRDEAEIRGHRRTYVGAIPGRIINAIKEAKTKNPVILLDEIDKMSSDFKGDPTAAMLEVLDPEQNKYFVDHYLELPFDLSKVMFITTANDLRQIPRPLYDRMEVIEIEGYLEEEKLEIVKKYILRKQLDQNGLKKNFIKMDDDVIKYVISCYTREAGVRQLERTIGKICRKVVKEMVENPDLKPLNLSKEDVKKYLGTEKFRQEPLDLNPQIGLVNGLAWTAVGGVTLEVEVNVLPGKGQIVLTGMMGDVMKESARTGISYIRSIASKLGIDENFYKDKDVHIHIPEGATPKDGPSAGITMTLATISALTERPVPGNIAMTGEITLRGRVLAVGGVREKVLAAYRMGIRKIIIPKECESDLDKIPENIKSQIEFILVDKMEQVLEAALMEK